MRTQQRWPRGHGPELARWAWPSFPHSRSSSGCCRGPVGMRLPGQFTLVCSSASSSLLLSSAFPSASSLSPSPGWHLEGPFPPTALPLPHRHAPLSHSRGNAAFPQLGVGISLPGSAAAITALDPDSIPMAKETWPSTSCSRGGEGRCGAGGSAVPSPRRESGREAGMHSGRWGWLTAPGAARDGLAAFPRGFSRQERAQQDKGQLVPARHQYKSIYLETSLCATQTVSPKHFISTSGEAQIKAAAGSSGELPPPGCCLEAGIAPWSVARGARRDAGKAGGDLDTHHFPLAPLADPAEDDGDAKADGDDG